jgi:hypothetical protein
MTWEFRDKSGRVIPADHFENEPGPPRDPRKSYSAAFLARFDRKTEIMAAVIAMRVFSPTLH